MSRPASLPELSPAQRRAEISRYIAECAADRAEASPAERELEALQRKDRLSADELSRLHQLSRSRAA